MSDGTTTVPERAAVSVIVVNWRQPELTERCIASLTAQVLAESMEVVLVENQATSEGIARLRRSCDSVNIVALPRNEGFAGGVNAGLAAAQGDVIVLINNDATAAPGFLAAGVNRLGSEDTTVAAVAAFMVLEGTFDRTTESDDEDSVLAGIDGMTWIESGSASARQLCNSTGVSVDSHANGQDRDWLVPVDEVCRVRDDDPFGFSGGGVFLRRSALDRIGPFDDRFFMYYEDLDLAWRLRLAGYRIVFEPDARLIHRHAASSGHQSPLLRFHSMRNRLLTVYKNGTVMLGAVVTIASLGRMAKDVVIGIRGRSKRSSSSGAYLSARDWRKLWASVLGMSLSTKRERKVTGAMAPLGVPRRTVARAFFHTAGRER